MNATSIVGLEVARRSSSPTDDSTRNYPFKMDEETALLESCSGVEVATSNCSTFCCVIKASRQSSNKRKQSTSALGCGDVPTASALLRDQEALLDRESAASPNDLMLLGFKGNLHTNKAVLYQRTNANDQASNELIEAEHAFRAVQEVEPQIPDVLTGLGNVAVLRGDLASGERLVRDALEIAPTNEEALRDLQQIEALRERPIQE